MYKVNINTDKSRISWLDWRKIMKLENIKTEDDLEKYDDYLNELENNGKITNDENYEFYNKAFEKVYGHSAFDNNDNFN